MNQFKEKWTLDREKYLNDTEVKKLKRIVQDRAIADLARGRATWVRFWVVIDLAVSAGLRVSEIAGLTVGNLHLKTREPRIRVTGKGDKTRDVFISRELKKHLTEYLKWKQIRGEAIGDDDHVIISSHGKCYTTRALQYAFKESAKKAGLPSYYSIHACRHSYGTFLYQKSKDLRLVQKQLGHSSITTTTVYADVTVGETLDAVNGLFEGGDDDEEQ